MEKSTKKEGDKVEEEKIIQAKEEIRILWEKLLSQGVLWIGLVIYVDHRGLPVQIIPVFDLNYLKSELYPVEIYHA
jgi:hypothetical protein